MILKLMIFLMISINVFAIENSPPDFAHKSGIAVFVDFIDAKYKVDIDFKKRTSSVVSRIEFYQDKAGYPIFDIRTKIQGLKVNNFKSSASEIIPPMSETKVRVLNKLMSKGHHVLEVTSDIAEFAGGIEFEEGKLDFDFSLSDMMDREFFEIWAVTNLEFDQFSSRLDLLIKNSNIQHKVYHNGTVTYQSGNHFKIQFPEYFSTSSAYIHIVPVNEYRELTFNILSSTGREIPVTIYTNEVSTQDDILDRAKKETEKVVKELEERIAPWPHPKLLIQIFEGSSGMEYHGATASGIEDLKHEIIHSYFARGVMPADGKSSWIDEAVTEWITHDYQSLKFPCSNAIDCSIKLNSLPQYIRHTTVWYSHGEAFISYLDYKFSDKGGMITFLAHFFEQYKFKTITTEIFQKELELFFSTDLTTDFQVYIYN